MLGPARRNLLRVLGLTFGLAVIIGNTIGAGIFRTPGEIASHLPTFWLFLSVWIIGGIYALLGANALSELGTRSSFYADKLFRQSDEFSGDELRSATVRLAQLDLALKGGSRLAPDLELQRALLDLSRERGPAESR